ncbi:hypothetical protein POM88_036737 [Heracleum sosnowskyi]|uniref:UBC core domain-containing protein n=1 Tax=Heracleum sosnowskyi TaxID=360622 RepID=A0AAD8HR90_9APIA|nr:hypothetical protein POM88_036737 [Heracleum sosnowskyi]
MIADVCLNDLQDKWSSTYDVRTILISIQSLLGEPNTRSPLNAQAAALWENQEEKCHQKFVLLPLSHSCNVVVGWIDMNSSCREIGETCLSNVAEIRNLAARYHNDNRMFICVV